MDPYTLAYLAGHSDFGTTRRYVHPQAQTIRDAMARVRKDEGGHKNGHTAQTPALDQKRGQSPINLTDKTSLGEPFDQIRGVTRTTQL
jgi:hypothetical protein